MPPSQEIENRTYYVGLDSLRGIAVLIVIISHYFHQNAFCRLGWIGVDLFFVLSGFLITNILLNSKKTVTNFFGNFYVRRILRIVPIYFIYLAAFFSIIYLFKKESYFTYYTTNAVYYFLFVQNWLFALKGLPGEHHLNHLWSLAVEEQFYLIWPFLIYFVKESNLVRILIIAILSICVLRSCIWALYPSNLEIYYFNTFTRIDSICFGCLLACGAIIPNSRVRRLLVACGILIITGGIFFFGSTLYTNPFFATIGYTLLAFVLYLLVQGYIQNASAGSIIKKNVLLNFIGKISYSLYLIHLPVYLFLKAAINDFNFPPFFLEMISFCIIMLVSTISYYLIELRFLRLKKYFLMNN